MGLIHSIISCLPHGTHLQPHYHILIQAAETEKKKYCRLDYPIHRRRGTKPFDRSIHLAPCFPSLSTPARGFATRKLLASWFSIAAGREEAAAMAGRANIPTNNSALIAIIADEDTVTGFLLAGVGNVDLRKKTNYLIVDNKTTVKQIEDAFKEFTAREDIAIVLISQYVANMIRFLVDGYNKPVPAILEIPSKDHPYDPAHDSVLSRVKYLFSAESVASDRR
ncbi:hypothetical protein BDA96_04G377900 [Sorghum bicolor]|uniref:V-type proton ATPase subunit F n=2 Tax=Sorghum bicolor TaxID=4558 RepID=A0A921R9R1_SORBI|nr:hypothetical protein BDA96_04G377900 [Sorghum bicolor]